MKFHTLSQRPYGAIAGQRTSLCGSTLLSVRSSAPCDRDSLRHGASTARNRTMAPVDLIAGRAAFFQRVLAALPLAVNRTACSAGCTVAALVFTRADNL